MLILAVFLKKLMFNGKKRFKKFELLWMRFWMLNCGKSEFILRKNKKEFGIQCTYAFYQVSFKNSVYRYFQRSRLALSNYLSRSLAKCE